MKTNKKLRLDIQGLRAIAVLAVLSFHIDKNILPGGFIGVDIFFVISGFLVSGIIFRQKEKNIFSFKNFYISRFKRIVPAYYVLVLFVLIIGSLILLPSDIAGLKYSIKWVVLFLSNIYLATLDDYFGMASSENPLLHTWTLAIEMQFYFIIPLLIYFIKRKILIPLLFISTILLLVYSEYKILHFGKSSSYFSLLDRSPEFLIGVLLNIFDLNKINKIIKNILSIIGLIFIICSMIFINEHSHFPGFLTLFPCLGAAFLIISNGSFINNCISNKVMTYIGELSYSIYLWHWPILAFLRYYICSYSFSFTLTIIALFIIFILSLISCKYIERFYRNLSNKLFLIYFSPIILFILGLYLFLNPINNSFSKIPLEYSEPNALGLNSHSIYYVSDTIRGDLNSQDTLLLLGDSHALAFSVFLEEVGKKNNFCFRSVTNDRYPTIPNLTLNNLPNFKQKETYDFLVKKVNEYITRSNIIILVKSWEFEIPSLVSALDSLMNTLPKEKTFIVMSDFPVLTRNPIRENRSFVRDINKHIDYEPHVPPIDTAIFSLQEKYNNFHIIDLSDSKAFENAPFFNDTIMYYDRGHLNRYGALKYEQYSGCEFIINLKKSVEINKQ